MSIKLGRRRVLKGLAAAGAGAFLRDDFTRMRSKRGELRSMTETLGADLDDGKRVFDA